MIWSSGRSPDEGPLQQFARDRMHARNLRGATGSGKVWAMYLVNLWGEAGRPKRIQIGKHRLWRWQIGGSPHP